MHKRSTASSRSKLRYAIQFFLAHARDSSPVQGKPNGVKGGEDVADLKKKLAAAEAKARDFGKQ